MIDEPMDLSDQRSDQRQGSPIVVAGSVRGTGHDEEGAPCEDAFAFESFDTPRQSGVAFAVADGAGSASCAAIGARVSTQSVVSALVEGATRQHEPANDNTWEKILEGALLRARTKLVLLSWTLGVDTSAFAATMLAGAFLEDGRLAYAQVGDGAIVAKRTKDPEEQSLEERSTEAAAAEGAAGKGTAAAGREDGSLTLVTERQGKYANEMIPLSSSESHEHWQVGVSEEPVAGVAAFTDGLSHMCLDLKAGEPRDSFLGELLRTNARLIAKEGVEKTNAGLRAYLGSGQVQSRTRDDVTLLMALRQSELPARERGGPEPPKSRDSDTAGSKTPGPTQSKETGPSKLEEARTPKAEVPEEDRAATGPRR